MHVILCGSLSLSELWMPKGVILLLLTIPASFLLFLVPGDWQKLVEH